MYVYTYVYIFIYNTLKFLNSTESTITAVTPMYLLSALLKSTRSTPPTSFAMMIIRASFDNILPVQVTV